MISCPSRRSLLCTGRNPSLLADSVRGNQPSGSMWRWVLMFMVSRTLGPRGLKCVQLTATFHSRDPSDRFMANIAFNCNVFHSSSMTPLLSATQVSTYLGISKRSLETLLARGEGPSFLWVGSQRRWVQQELINWTLQRNEKPRKAGQSLNH